MRMHKSNKRYVMVPEIADRHLDDGKFRMLFATVDLYERQCQSCKVIEDEKHFLCVCPM